RPPSNSSLSLGGIIKKVSSQENACPILLFPTNPTVASSKSSACTFCEIALLRAAGTVVESHTVDLCGTISRKNDKKVDVPSDKALIAVARQPTVEDEKHDCPDLATRR